VLSGRNLVHWLFLFACNLMWALQFTCIKLVQDQVGPLFTVWGPMTLSTVLLVPFILRERRANRTESRREKKDILIYGLLAILGVFPGQVLITWGTRWSLASNAALLMLTLPVCTALMAYIFLGERMTPVRWLSFILAILGVVLCSDIDWGNLNFGAGFLAGNLLIFVGLNGSAFYNSYGKKILARYSPMEMLFFTYLGMFVVMTPLTLALEPDVWARIPNFTLQTWIGLIILTLFHNYLSMVLFLMALKRLHAIQVALSNYLITFFGLPIAAIWLHERLTLLAVVGGVIVLCSTLLITLWEDARAIKAERASRADI
jgi:drug/metabolite transporter (DMT)-like permease